MAKRKPPTGNPPAGFAAKMQAAFNSFIGRFNKATASAGSNIPKGGTQPQPSPTPAGGTQTSQPSAGLWGRFQSLLARIDQKLGQAGGMKPQALPPQQTFMGMPLQPGMHGYQTPPPSLPPPKPTWTQRISGAFGLAQGGVQSVSSAAPNPQQTVQAGNKRGGFLGRMQSAFGYGTAGAQSVSQSRDIQGFGNFLAGFGKVVGMIPGAGGPLEAFTKLGKSVFDSIDNLQKWSRQLHDANMQFAEFSVSMSMVQAGQYFRDIQYSRERGEQRAAGAEDQAEQYSRLRGNVAGYGDTASHITNWVDARLNQFGSWFMETTRLNEFGDWMSRITGGQQKEEPLDAGERLDDIVEQWQRAMAERRPARMQNNRP